MRTPPSGQSALLNVDFQAPGSGLRDSDLSIYGLTKAALLSYFSVHPTDNLSGTTYTHDGTPGTLTWEFNSGSQAFNFLAAGETLVVYYPSIRPDDHQSSPAIGDGAIFVRIDGTNDAAVIGTPTVADVTEDQNVNSGGLLTASGAISISDVDQGQGFQTGTVDAPDSNNLGSLSLSADGCYTYSVTNDAVQYLGDGDSKVDSFTVTAVDGTTKDVSFTIHGSNDAAVIGARPCRVINVTRRPYGGI